MNKFKEQKQKISDLENQLEKEKELLQKFCEHENIEFYDSELQEYGGNISFTPQVIRCYDCGLYIDSNEENFEEFKSKFIINS